MLKIKAIITLLGFGIILKIFFIDDNTSDVRWKVSFDKSNTMNKLHEHAETTAIEKRASPRAENSPCQQKQHHMIKPHEHDETTADPNACTRTMFPGLCSAKLHCTCTHACIAPLHPVGRWAGKRAQVDGCVKRFRAWVAGDVA